MRAVVPIIERATGHVRLHYDDWRAENSPQYQWADGNYGCDCNRALFFARAGGEPDPDEYPCGETRFYVPFAVLDDGSTVLIDPAPDAAPHRE